MEKIKRSIKRYWNWRSESYGLDNDKSIKIATKWRRVLGDIVKGTPGRYALDIGTGCGQFALYLSNLGFKVTAVDLSENMIALARKYSIEQKINIDFQIQDAERLKFDDNTFDVVVSRNLLWTLPNPEQALKEWHRVMKPGGTLVVSDGFWKNYTWTRIHYLLINLLRGLFKKNGLISGRFFLTYANLYKTLPFYEGIHVNEANKLLKKVKFKDINSYDTSCFHKNPYFKKRLNKKNGPVFFIAYAKR